MKNFQKSRVLLLNNRQYSTLYKIFYIFRDICTKIIMEIESEKTDRLCGERFVFCRLKFFNSSTTAIAVPLLLRKRLSPPIKVCPFQNDKEANIAKPSPAGEGVSLRLTNEALLYFVIMSFQAAHLPLLPKNLFYLILQAGEELFFAWSAA